MNITDAIQFMLGSVFIGMGVVILGLSVIVTMSLVNGYCQQRDKRRER